MAQTVGGLIVNLVARTKSFTRNMRRARGQVGSFRNETTRAQRAMIAFGKVTAAIGSVAVLGSLYKRTIDEVDALDKMADRLGTTSGELAGLQFVAERTGVQISALNMGLQRMTRRVSEAAIGTGEAVNALRELQLDAAELNKVGLQQRFLMIAQAMRQVSSETDRVRLAFKLFDSEGVALKNTLALNDEEFGNLMKRARFLGAVRPQGSVDKMVEAKDALTDLGVAWKSFMMELTSGNSIVTKVVKVATNVLVVIRKITETMNLGLGLLKDFAMFTFLGRQDKAFDFNKTRSQAENILGRPIGSGSTFGGASSDDVVKEVRETNNLLRDQNTRGVALRME